MLSQNPSYSSLKTYPLHDDSNRVSVEFLWLQPWLLIRIINSWNLLKKNQSLTIFFSLQLSLSDCPSWRRRWWAWIQLCNPVGGRWHLLFCTSSSQESGYGWWNALLRSDNMLYSCWFGQWRHSSSVSSLWKRTTFFDKSSSAWIGSIWDGCVGIAR